MVKVNSRVKIFSSDKPHKENCKEDQNLLIFTISSQSLNKFLITEEYYLYQEFSGAWRYDMSKKMKWFVGILIGLVVVAVLMTAGFMAFDRWGRPRLEKQGRSAQTWEQKGDQKWEGKDNHPWNQIPRREMLAQPYYRTPHSRFGGFFPLGLIFGSLFYLGVLTLMVLGVIALIRHLRRPIQPAVLAGAAAASPESTLVSEADASQAFIHSCSNCSRSVQEDWSHCPYCGTVQKT
jgi:hypothetical protein